MPLLNHECASHYRLAAEAPQGNFPPNLPLVWMVYRAIRSLGTERVGETVKGDADISGIFVPVLAILLELFVKFPKGYLR